MDLAESGLTIIAGMLMLIALVASVLLPFIPGPFILWGIGMIFGVLTGFAHFTGLSAVISTLLMIVATTKDLWMPIVGMKRYNLSCSTALGMFFGGIVGTFAIPIP